MRILFLFCIFVWCLTQKVILIVPLSSNTRPILIVWFNWTFYTLCWLYIKEHKSLGCEEAKMEDKETSSTFNSESISSSKELYLCYRIPFWLLLFRITFLLLNFEFSVWVLIWNNLVQSSSLTKILRSISPRCGQVRVSECGESPRCPLVTGLDS